jgi:hypothetical protein
VSKGLLGCDAFSGTAERPQSFRHEIEVNADPYDALPDGAAVPILYARSDPSVSRQAQESSHAIFIHEGLLLALLGRERAALVALATGFGPAAHQSCPVPHPLPWRLPSWPMHPPPASWWVM